MDSSAGSNGPASLKRLDLSGGRTIYVGGGGGIDVAAGGGVVLAGGVVARGMRIMVWDLGGGVVDVVEGGTGS